MTFAWQILIHTPVWVWMLLAFLLWQGIQAMRPRRTPIWRALIVPVAFIAWGCRGSASATKTAFGRWSHGSRPRWCCCLSAC